MKTQGSMERGARRPAMIWKAARGAVPTVVCLVLAPTQAHGFEAKDILAFSAGPFVIRPKLSVSETYNDNLFYSGGQDSPEQSAFMTGVTPAVDIRLGRLDGDNVFHLKYDFNQYWYHDVSEIDTAIAHTLALTATIRRDRLSADTAFSYSFSDTVYGGYESFQQGGGGGGANVGRNSLSLSQSLRYQISEKTAPYGRFTLSDLKFDESQATRFYDQNAWRILGGVGYRVRPKVEAIGEVHYGQTASNPPDSLLQKPPHLETLGGFAGANLSFTTKLKGTLKVGYEQSHASANSQVAEVDFGTPVASVSLTSALTERSNATLAYTRGTGASVQAYASAYTSDNFSLRLQHVFGTAHPWTVSAGGTYGLNYYEPSTTAAGVPILGYDRDYLGATASIAYRPRLWLTVGLYYRYQQSSGSAASGVDYTVNEVTLAVSAGY